MEVSFTNIASGRLLPWNRVYEVELRRRVNPIAMFARDWSRRRDLLTMPLLGKPIGLDLMRSDWVAPYGSGQVSDFLLQLDIEDSDLPKSFYDLFPRMGRYSNTTLTVSFPNDGDGIREIKGHPIKGSRLRLPRIAPDDGYATNLVCVTSYSESGDRNDMNVDDQNYFFRVRTQKDAGGNVTNALYGKIHGQFEYFVIGKIQFAYYLTPPPNDRNVEFDPTKNLLRGKVPDHELCQEP
jgi:hypothetical protein